MAYYSFIIFACWVGSVTSVKIQQISSPEFITEGPHWHEGQQALYFISSGVTSRIHKYVPATGVHTKSRRVDGRMGFIVPVNGTCDQFLVGLKRRFVVVRWDGREEAPFCEVREIGEVDCDVNTTNINDGKVDPRGRVFAGTMGTMGIFPDYELKKGSLFRLDGPKITKVEKGITISNGLSWDIREKAMYYIDSWERNIRRYDYHVETGRISNLTYIFDFEKNNIEGYPDGQTIDVDGNLWVAVFEGSCVIKINPKSGKLLRKVMLPVRQVTSVTFGGPNYDILFVTTGNFNSLPPPNGATFMVTGLRAKGTRNLSYRL